MNQKIAKSASRDFIYSVLALMVYNGVLQLVIYPYLNSHMGAEAFGTVLYLISVISVMGASFGSGASYGRMVAKAQRTQTNGDYNIFLWIIAGISVAVSLVTLVVLHEFQIGLYLQLLVLMVISVFRYYSDVQYRMTIRFKEYFIFYTAIAAGNLLGIALYPISKSWSLTVFLGEFLAVLYTFFSGTIFRKPYFEKSQDFKESMHAVWVLSSANLVSALILNSDRLLIRTLIGAQEVTTFYTATLIGKIVAMLTTPLNGIIISYLTNYKMKFTKKIFAGVCGAMLAVSILASGACTFISWYFVKIMYANVFEAAKPYFLLANAGQIFYFISGSLMVVVLNFTKEKYQLYINICYLIVFAVIVIPSILLFGLNGIAWGLLITNIARFVIVMIVGFKFIR